MFASLYWINFFRKKKSKDDTSEQVSQDRLKLDEENTVKFKESTCSICANRPASVQMTDKLEGMNVFSAIGAVTNIAISASDSYSKSICNNCLAELKVALKFKKRCDKSAWRLNSSPVDIFEPPLPPPPMVFHDFPMIIQQMHKEMRLRTPYKSLEDKPLQNQQNNYANKINTTVLGDFFGNNMAEDDMYSADSDLIQKYGMKYIEPLEVAQVKSKYLAGKSHRKCAEYIKESQMKAKSLPSNCLAKYKEPVVEYEFEGKSIIDSQYKVSSASAILLIATMSKDLHENLCEEDSTLALW